MAVANSWWEIRILCHPSLEETAFWRLEKFGCVGTSTEKKAHSLLIRGYLPQEKAEILDLAALALWCEQDALLLQVPKPRFHWQLIDEEDWSISWKEHWQPTPVGDRFIIYPAWIDPLDPGDRLILRLDPGVAFGTGTHATTQLCLESLEMRVDPDKNQVLADLGCGSGILGIGAILLGAAKVYGVDNDPLTVDSARHNRHLNQIHPDNLVINEGSVLELEQLIAEPVDGIICNILADVIVDLLPQFTPLVKPQGWAILSGIMVEQSQAIADALEQNGWTVVAIWKRQEWCCFQARREDSD
ncbi:50S ribosomal protein L11 methyltransferase [Synechocystis sp. LEGE 06083]|uniref:50S ribosomal protein L11 methyltransferase n=1 Tax=Synechocystis sp. LEGE 06083 TaxID=915336 RepID=UPI00187FF9E5|nr:50S ribosomal protein L11 methyltransferase [Synechocystis sp. LEGE 06083]MBE9196325.1 50S ribosomal protein L11 methyltransferase [Synechocystis sp. LEGE 06083]